MWHVYVFNVLLIASSLAAIILGGAPEKLVALILVAAVGVSRYGRLLVPTFGSLDFALLAIDVVATLMVGLVAIRANRFWPMWVVALMLQMVLGHMLRIADPTLFPWLYWLTSSFSGYPIQVILLFAAIRHYRNRNAPSEKSWSVFSNRLVS